MISSKLLKNVKSVKTILNAKNKHLKEFKLDISTDSRTISKGQCFVALVGENFDGFSYLEQVLNAEAKVVVFTLTKEREELLPMLAAIYADVIFITVDDTLAFIQQLAHEHMLAWKKAKKSRLVIGITGSNGKTTHKEMVFALLNSIFPKKVLATKGNLNNHIGVPLTLFNLTSKHEVAIIEMGMSGFGEIKALCDIADPMAGMITNIGAAHIEFLKTMENILKEKGSLYDAVVKNTKGKGVFVVNADDEYLRKLTKSKGLLTYGESNGDVRLEMNGQELHLKNKQLDIRFTNNNLPEPHNLKNLAGTLLFCVTLFPKFQKKLIAAAANYTQPSMNRSQWMNNIFLDAYNANPSSMKISLDSFVKVMKQKQISLDDCYFVLGDMNELGEHAPSMHESIGKLLMDLGIHNVAFIGRYREFYLRGFSEKCLSYATKEEFLDEWKGIQKKYKFLFIKASRSLKLETLVKLD